MSEYLNINYKILNDFIQQMKLSEDAHHSLHSLIAANFTYPNKINELKFITNNNIYTFKPALIKSLMGNQCHCPFYDAKDNFLYFQKQSSKNAYISENEWVKQLKQSSSEKLILDHSTFNDQNAFYYLITDPTNPNRGVIYTAECYYEGPIKERMAHGKGIEFFKEGGMYNGYFQKNVRHGDGNYDNLHIAFNGKWNYGCPKSGELITNQRKTYLIEKIQFTDKSMKEATIQMTLPDKSLYQGKIIRNTQSKFNQYSLVKGILTMPNKDYFNGEFLNGKFHHGTYQWQNGKQYFGGFKQGLKHDAQGIFCYNKNQNLYITGKWQNGVKVGIFKNYAVQKQEKLHLATYQFYEQGTKMRPILETIPLRKSPQVAKNK